MGRSAKPFKMGSTPILTSINNYMKKLIFITSLLAFGAGIIIGWNFIPQPQWLFNAYGHFLLFK